MNLIRISESMPATRSSSSANCTVLSRQGLYTLLNLHTRRALSVGAAASGRSPLCAYPRAYTENGSLLPQSLLLLLLGMS